MYFDVAASPELPLERLRLGLHGPGPIRKGLVAPEPVEDDAQVPVGHRVAEEEEVAASGALPRAQRERAGKIRLREVVDVVVLGDDEALPLAARERDQPGRAASGSPSC